MPKLVKTRTPSDKPLQRMNVCAARSSAGRAATPRAGARGSSRLSYAQEYLSMT
jgi:hypothetical protein